MSWHQAKSYPADTAFSLYVRKRDKKCVMCGRTGTGPDGILGLQAAHYFSRGKWSVRYDPDNVDALCISCHRKTHKNSVIHEDFKYLQLGQQRFDELTIRAWNKSQMGSSFWKKMTKKQAEDIFLQLK